MNQLAHRQHFRATELEAAAGIGLGIERCVGDRLGDVGDEHRLEACARADDRHCRRRLDHAGEAIHEGVLRAEHDRRADDRRLREGRAHRGFALALGAGIVDRRCRIGADRRDMHQRPGARRGGGLGDVARALDMDKVHLAGEDADQIDHRVTAGDSAADGIGLGDVGRDKLGLAEAAQWLHKKGALGVAPDDPHPHAALQQRLRDIAPQEPATAEQRHQLCHRQTILVSKSQSAVALPPPRQENKHREKIAVDSPANPPLSAAAYPVPRWRNW